VTEIQLPPKKKSNTAKVLVGCGILAVLLLCGSGIGLYFAYNSMMLTTPAQIEAQATEIVGTHAPEGYEGSLGMSVLGFKFAVLSGGGGHVLLVASAKKQQAARIEAQMRESLSAQLAGEGATERLEPEVFDVGGRQVQFKKELSHGAGLPQLQYSGLLPERDGRVSMVIYIGPQDGFDKATMVAYLKRVPGN